MDLNKREHSRYCVATGEEVWVRACYQFFQEYGFWDWYQVSQEVAFVTIMKNTRCQGNPVQIRERISDLYKNAGVK